MSNTPICADKVQTNKQKETTKLNAKKISERVDAIFYIYITELHKKKKILNLTTASYCSKNKASSSFQPQSTSSYITSEKCNFFTIKMCPTAIGDIT